MADRNLDLALRMKADVTQAVDGLKNVRTEIEKTDGAAAKTGKSTQGLGDALDKAGKTAKGLGDALDKAAKTETAAATAAAKHTQDLNAVGAAMRGAATDSDKLGKSIGKFAGNLATGNFSGAAREAEKLGVNAGRAAVGAGVLGTVVVGMVAELGLFAYAAAQAAIEEGKLNRALTETGNASGLTFASFEHLATSIAGSNAQLGQARQVVLALAADGRVTAQSMQLLAQAAMDVATVTGKSASQAAAEVTKMFDGSIQSLLRANDQWHFLNASILQHIQDLQDAGDQQGALQVAAEAFHNAVDPRIQQMQDDVHGIAAAWRDVKNAFKGYWEDFKTASAVMAGTADKQTQLFYWMGKQSQAAAKGGATQGGWKNLLFGWDDAYKQASQHVTQLRQDLATAEDEAAKKAAQDRLDADGAAGQAYLSQTLKQYADRETQRVGKIKDIVANGNKAIADAQSKGDAAAVQRAQTDMADAIARVNARFATKSPRARIDNSAAREAERIAREAAKAQDQLTQSLIQMQGQLDPTAAVWAKYNDAVKRATDEAESAKRAQGANAASIDSQRDAIIGLAATMRDAALDKLADADRQAWQRLKDSLRDPVEVATDDAVAKLLELNRLMEKLKGTKDEISPDQYAKAAQSIVQKGIGTAPQQTQMDTDYTGGGRMFAQNFQERAELEKWHTDALKANEDFRQKDLISEQQYQQQLASINAQYNAQRTANDKARGDILLSTTANIFGELATLSSSHNKKVAAIGKAAAIAQTIIKTYQSATGAYAALSSIPYIGPALGAAAAAAAIAAGMANVAAIRSQNTGGYAEGGYTGPGGKHTPAGIVHAGEVVWSQADIARAGGVGIVETMRLRGYADGGVVSPFANAPSPSDLGFTAPRGPNVDFSRLAANDGGGRAPTVNVKTVMVLNSDQLAEEILNTPAGTRLVVQHVSDNPRKIQGNWGR